MGRIEPALNPDPIIAWLLDGDPAVAWQAERDLLGLDRSAWIETRGRVADEGWGARLLGEQDPGGTWGGGLYGPKWTSTTYTLLLLRSFGLDPVSERAIRGARRLLDDADWVDRGVSFSSDPLAERCINGMVLSIVAYFDVADDRIDGIAENLIRGRLDDGGWNCQDHRGDTGHSSFHTTISVLEGLLEWKRRTDSGVADRHIHAGHQFMLEHRMFRSHTDGSVINEAWTRFSFPPRWHYDVLRGLDHLRDAGSDPDPRAGEAVELVRKRRRRDGRWTVGPSHPGKTYFTMEQGRRPGRWNTLRALRVLRWWGT